MAPHVLVADDDVLILHMVQTVLTKRGYSVDTAADGKAALDRAQAHPPDLLVTDVMMPQLDGWTLVRTLRADPRLARLPVIFLTALSSEDDKIRGFRLGADDYILKPFQFEDLAQRVASVLGRAAAARTPAKPASSGLRGDLAQVALSTLLVLIEMERKTGVLALRSATGKTAQILARDGKIVQARLDRDPRVDAACIYHLLTWEAGEFEFVAKKVDAVDRVNVSTTHLLMESARLADEAAAGVAPSPATSLRFEAGELDAEAAEEWQQDQRTPLVVAAKLAELVRQTARASIPPPFAGVQVPAPVPVPVPVPAEPVPVVPDPPIVAELAPELDSVPVRAPTESTASVRRPRATWPWLMAPVVAAIGGVAVWKITSEPTDEVASTALQADADALRSSLELTTSQVKMRGDGFAANPVLRAAIATDAATLRDLQHNESLLSALPGETIEVFQGSGTSLTSLLRVPDDAPPLRPTPDQPIRISPSGKTDLAVVHFAPIVDQRSQPAGAVVIGLRCDLADVRRRLAQHTKRAVVLGPTPPIALVGDPAGAPPATKLAITAGITLAVEPR